MTTTAFVDNSTLIQASWLNDVDTVTYQYLTSVAGTNTITATGPASMSAYAAGQTFRFIPANTNTGATTINITPAALAALGAKNIFSGGAACIGGEIQANVPVVVIYDGTQFNLIGAVGKSSSWTPALAFGGASTGIAYTTQVGSAKRIGNVEILFAHIILSSKGSATGTATITGAPVTARTLSGIVYVAAMRASSMGGAITMHHLQPYIDSGTSSILLQYLIAGNTANMADTDFSATSDIAICIIYEV